MRGQNAARPAIEEQRGQEGDLGEQGGDDADGPDRAQAVQGGRLRRQQADHGAGDGAGGGQQGGQGRSQRGGHRVLGGGMAAQLLPVTVDEQQRVVRGRAQDQHPQDRGRQRADGEPGVSEPVRGGLGGDDGPERAEQRQQPQEGAAVDDDEDDHDDHEGGEQQGVLGTAADAAVGVHRGRSGHGGLQAVTGAADRPADHPADGLHRGGVSAGLAGGRGGDVRGELIGLPVGRPLRPAGSAEPLRRDRRGVPPRRGPRRPPSGPRPSGHCRGRTPLSPSRRQAAPAPARAGRPAWKAPRPAGWPRRCHWSRRTGRGPAGREPRGRAPRRSAPASAAGAACARAGRPTPAARRPGIRGM